MKPTLCLLIFIVAGIGLNAQDEILPRGFSAYEHEQMLRGDFERYQPERGITSPPPYSDLRCMAEWEEIQALTIAWTGYPGILKQIVAAAKEETRVIILSGNPQQTEDFLLSDLAVPPLPDLNNVTIIEADFNSIWMRDYGANSVYGEHVDDLFLADWIYNRPTRPDDDASPQAIADLLGIDLYCMTSAPSDLVNTGGNWMTDGSGQAFASRLVLEENDENNPYEVSAKTESDIETIVSNFLGIQSYAKMTQLTYDGINHIDMHMKLLDEQTLLVGQYPEGIADGPQINANLEYILSNFETNWGTPYHIIRIPMPDSPSGLWPDSEPTPSYYRTYTNSVFVNKTVLLPLYREEYDTTAIRIYEEALPGYRIVGIDCDNNAENIISSGGALHCITHSVGVPDPLLITHEPLSDTDNTTMPYTVNASMAHRDGISTGTLYWKTATADDYTAVDMWPTGDNIWSGDIPPLPIGTRVYYYLRGEAVSGKVQYRPMPAPEGFWSFDITGTPTQINASQPVSLNAAYPNPASAITCIPLHFKKALNGTLSIMDMTGREVQQIHTGQFPPGERRFFFNASEIAPGAYRITFRSNECVISRPVIIR